MTEKLITNLTGCFT